MRQIKPICINMHIAMTWNFKYKYYLNTSLNIFEFKEFNTGYKRIKQHHLWLISWKWIWGRTAISSISILQNVLLYHNMWIITFFDVMCICLHKFALTSQTMSIFQSPRPRICSFCISVVSFLVIFLLLHCSTHLHQLPPSYVYSTLILFLFHYYSDKSFILLIYADEVSCKSLNWC